MHLLTCRSDPRCVMRRHQRVSHRENTQPYHHTQDGETAGIGPLSGKTVQGGHAIEHNVLTERTPITGGGTRHGLPIGELERGA
jgi:hypothetical protein